MYKEVVSLAIIIGWFLNFFYVEHPDTKSYTLYFSISLLGLSPFVLLWKYWISKTSTPKEELAVSGIMDVARSLEEGVGMVSRDVPTESEKELADEEEVHD